MSAPQIIPQVFDFSESVYLETLAETALSSDQTSSKDVIEFVLASLNEIQRRCQSLDMSVRDERASFGSIADLSSSESGQEAWIDTTLTTHTQQLQKLFGNELFASIRSSYESGRKSNKEMLTDEAARDSRSGRITSSLTQAILKLSAVHDYFREKILSQKDALVVDFDSLYDQFASQLDSVQMELQVLLTDVSAVFAQADSFSNMKAAHVADSCPANSDLQQNIYADISTTIQHADVVSTDSAKQHTILDASDISSPQYEEENRLPERQHEQMLNRSADQLDNNVVESYDKSMDKSADRRLKRLEVEIPPPEPPSVLNLLQGSPLLRATLARLKHRSDEECVQQIRLYSMKRIATLVCQWSRQRYQHAWSHWVRYARSVRARESSVTRLRAICESHRKFHLTKFCFCTWRLLLNPDIKLQPNSQSTTAPSAGRFDRPVHHRDMNPAKEHFTNHRGMIVDAHIKPASGKRRSDQIRRDLAQVQLLLSRSSETLRSLSGGSTPSVGAANTTSSSETAAAAVNTKASTENDESDSDTGGLIIDSREAALQVLVFEMRRLGLCLERHEAEVRSLDLTLQECVTLVGSAAQSIEADNADMIT